MFWNRRADTAPAPEGPGLSDHIRTLLASASGYIRARAELAGLEGKEAVVLYGRIAAFVLGAAVLLLFGYVFLWIGLIAVISLLAGTHWGWITLIVALIHFIGTALCLVAAYQHWGKPIFTATLEEFRKDQQWLSETSGPTNPTHERPL